MRAQESEALISRVSMECAEGLLRTVYLLEQLELITIIKYKSEINNCSVRRYVKSALHDWRGSRNGILDFALTKLAENARCM